MKSLFPTFNASRSLSETLREKKEKKLPEVFEKNNYYKKNMLIIFRNQTGKHIKTYQLIACRCEFQFFFNFLSNFLNSYLSLFNCTLGSMKPRNKSCTKIWVYKLSTQSHRYKWNEMRTNWINNEPKMNISQFSSILTIEYKTL